MRSTASQYEFMATQRWCRAANPTILVGTGWKTNGSVVIAKRCSMLLRISCLVGIAVSCTFAAAAEPPFELGPVVKAAVGPEGNYGFRDWCG